MCSFQTRCWAIVVLTAALVSSGTSQQYGSNPFLQNLQGEFHTEPRRALVKLGGSVTLLANAGRPLLTCHFWLPGSTGRLVDLSKGSASTSSDQYEYFGSGLNRGDCGIKFKRVVATDDGIVECKVLPVGSNQWLRSVTTLRVSERPIEDFPSFDIEPQTRTLTVGDEFTVTCNANRPITLCHIFLPGGKHLNFDRGADSEVTNDYQYLGSGLADGKCGATVIATSTALTGYVVCKVGDWPEDLSGPWETAALKIETKNAVRNPISRPTTTRRPLPGGPISCAPLMAPTLLIACVFARDTVNCARPQRPGTIASLNCKPGYAKVSSSLYNTITCKTDGEWDRDPFQCVPDCGKRKTNRGVVLVSGGQDSQVGEFPWHVGFYEKVEGEYAQTCGGSLITPSLIISAAHCFWSEQTNTKNSPLRYKVAAGKYMREWKLFNERIQKRDVLEIKVQPLYRGRDTSYAYDIALVRVSSPFTITASVNLICLDLENTFGSKQLVSGNLGIVTGWGYTENNTQSDSLRYADLPYVDDITCQRALDSDLIRLLTNDKFCAGYRHKSVSACGGDSGGGLVFQNKDNGKYYLRGVVSIAFTPADIDEICYSQQYTGFTRLSQYHTWIQENS